MSAQTVPPIDIPTAVANPALRDEHSIMVNVGELRRLVRRAEGGELDGVARDVLLVLPVEYPRSPAAFAAALRLNDWCGEMLRDRDRREQVQRPSIEDAIAAELEAGA